MACHGWRLTALVNLAIVAGLALHFGASGWTSTSVAAGIDATGRSSLVLFSMAFVASSVQRLWPSSLSQWMLQNRRWIGLSFASSHGIHLALILAMSLAFPDPVVMPTPQSAHFYTVGVCYMGSSLQAYVDLAAEFGYVPVALRGDDVADFTRAQAQELADRVAFYEAKYARVGRTARAFVPPPSAPPPREES